MLGVRIEGGQCGGGMCMLREVVDMAYERAQRGWRRSG